MQKKKGRKCDKDAEDGEMKEEERQMGPERRQRDTESLKKKRERVSSSASREGLLFSVHVVSWLTTS